MSTKLLRIVSVDSDVIDELLENRNSHSVDYEYMTPCNSVAGSNFSEERIDSMHLLLYPEDRKLGSMILGDTVTHL
jgi:hypothetical protein